VASSSTPQSARRSQDFVRLQVDAEDRPRAERAAAEAYAAGAVGLEERAGEGAYPCRLLLFAPASRAGAVRRAVAGVDGVRVGDPEAVPDTDWSEAWKEGLAPIIVSPRLVIRPSFVAHVAAPGQCVLKIGLGQAFGTGGHASTRLALEWIDRLAPGLPANASVLDVGTGTGVLALAALRLGPPGTRAIAFDLDPLAAPSARAHALENGLVGAFQVFTGGFDALAPVEFELVVANLLCAEMLPCLGRIAACTRPGGHAVFSGLLAGERQSVAEALAAAGLGVVGEREMRDEEGESWLSLCAGKDGSPSGSSAA